MVFIVDACMDHGISGLQPLHGKKLSAVGYTNAAGHMVTITMVSMLMHAWITVSAVYNSWEEVISGAGGDIPMLQVTCMVTIAMVSMSMHACSTVSAVYNSWEEVISGAGGDYQCCRSHAWFYSYGFNVDACVWITVSAVYNSWEEVISGGDTMQCCNLGHMHGYMVSMLMHAMDQGISQERINSVVLANHACMLTTCMQALLF